MRNRILSLEDIDGLNELDLEQLKSTGFLLPLAGAEGEDDDPGDDPTDEDPIDDPEDDPVDDPDDDPDADIEQVSRAELNRLKRIAAEAEKKAKQAEREERKRRERARAEAGQFQELLDERDEHAREIEAERDEARYELENYKREVRVTKIAQRLNYRDPSDAARFLTDDETEDDASTERALKRLAKEKSYLVEPRRSSGIPVGGEAGGLTLDEINNMTPDQINARWGEVQAAMAAAGQ